MLGLARFYILFTLIMRTLGCLIPLLIILGIGGYIIYAIGGFNGGIKNTKKNLEAYINEPQATEAFPQLSINKPKLLDSASQPLVQPLSQPQDQIQLNPEVVLPTRPKQYPHKNINPHSYPQVTSRAKVVKADVLQFYNGQYVKLYGIDAPDLDQTCSNKQGRKYFCGKQGQAWLNSWVKDFEVKCHIIKTDAKNNCLAVCFLGQYDIAAATIQAGWGFTTSAIYQPYEDMAATEKKGIWQGRFQTPQEWRKVKKGQ